MARILYGVCGEGLGHAIRSKILINYLKEKNYEIRIVAGGKAYSLLSKEFSYVEKIETAKFVFKDNKSRLFYTVLRTLYKTITTGLSSYFKVRRIIKDFKPDIIITDAEPISHIAARISKIKRLSIDNPHSLLYRKYKVSRGEYFSWFLLIFALKITMFGADKYIIYDYFDEQIDNPFVLFIKPLIQKEVLEQNPKYGKYIFVYQSLTDNDFVCNTLKKLDEKFIVYGFNKSNVDKNLAFKQFNQDEIFKDLSDAKAVITNGGFNLISEALYLKKPIYSLPIKYQFEQVLNGKFVEKLGAGVCQTNLDEKNLKKFLNNLDYYRENLKSYNPGNQKDILKKIEEEIKILVSKK